ncbi:replication initiation and membrane attachment family protein [Alkalihalobacterium bogoriense]|uniref:replication initiation and membrane attachment family protein n=1 Tax=Alkalihalobacterium bogoriense TaxID=246272 RepID=UPI00047AF364|nr:replication initiation and membrane attachment family protein [Alkalihalobacterium bogoriense]
MSWHWTELLPIDRYTVRTVDHLHELDQKVLTLLYQPLIGTMAYSLYMTLWGDLETDRYISGENSHRYLMTVMDVPLQHIYEQRKKLEGIGLLKTYKKKEEESSMYIYELHPPMSPFQFFQNDVLSVFLYNRIGKTKYRQVRERFIIDSINKDDYHEVTRAFDEVFSSLHHSEIVRHYQSEVSDVMEIEQEKDLIQRDKNDPLVFMESKFDFELLEADLSNIIAPKELLTKDVRETIVKLAFVYRIQPLEMSRVIQRAVIHDDEIDLQMLRKKVQDWYKLEHGSEPPSLGLRTQPIPLQTMKDKEPSTEEERMVKLYETTSPIALLESRGEGAKVADADAKIVESLILDYQLTPGVANVLLDYTLFRNDMKLSKAFVDKIAGHWSRKKIKTVIEAMQLAKDEHKKAAEFQQQAKKAPVSKTKPKQSIRKDKLPKWLVEEKQGKVEKTVMTEQTDEEFERKKKQFEMMIKNRKKDNE